MKTFQISKKGVYIRIKGYSFMTFPDKEGYIIVIYNSNETFSFNCRGAMNKTQAFNMIINGTAETIKS